MRGTLRPGHTRPAGTVWRMRVHSWGQRKPVPVLGDLVFEALESQTWEGSDDSLHRGFLCVGVEETRVPTTFRLHLERLDWEDFILRVRDELDDARVWGFLRDRR